MRFKTIFPINKPIIFSLAVVFVLLTASQAVDARPRRINKLLIIYNNGKNSIVYTLDKPNTYISSHGGPAVIKQVRLLKRWFIDDRGSLYGKNLRATEPNTKDSTPKISARTSSTAKNSKPQSQNILTVPRHKNSPLKSSESTNTLQLTKDTRQPKNTPTIVADTPSTTKGSKPQSQNTLTVPRHKNSPLKSSESTNTLQLTKDAHQPKDTSTIVASKTPSVGTTPSARPIVLSPTILKRIARYEKSINLYAQKYKLEPNLLKAVVYVESSGNPYAVSNKGAKGLMQLMDETAKDMNVQNVFNPIQNIEGGAKYLRQQLNTFQNNLSLALAAYNSGPRHVKQKVIFQETKKYVKKVFAVEKALSLEE